MSNEERKYTGNEIFLLVNDNDDNRVIKRGHDQFLLGPLEANQKYSSLYQASVLMHIVKQCGHYQVLILVEAVVKYSYPNVLRFGTTSEAEQAALINIIDPR